MEEGRGCTMVGASLGKTGGQERTLRNVSPSERPGTLTPVSLGSLLCEGVRLLALRSQRKMRKIFTLATRKMVRINNRNI